MASNTSARPLLSMMWTTQDRIQKHTLILINFIARRGLCHNIQITELILLGHEMS